MKTRRISTHRIGTDSKSRKRKASPLVGLLGILTGVLFGWFVLTWWPRRIESVVQITVIATASPLPTATATMLTPTMTPVQLATSTPTPTPVFGIALGDVWLRKTAGGERLPAAVLKGQRVEILEDGGDYLKVCWTDDETVLTGWVTAAWVEVQSERN